MPVTNTINLNELAATAERLESLLERYALDHKAAKDVLVRHRDLIQEAKQMKLNVPQRKGFLPEEMWESGDLFEFTDLCDCAAQFSLLLQGWSSLADFRQSMKDVERIAELEEKEFRKKHEK